MPSVTKAPYNTHFSGYGLGSFLSDIKGYKQVSHTGGLEGNVTQFTMIPEIGLGIIVFTNQQSGSAFLCHNKYYKRQLFRRRNQRLFKIYSERETQTFKDYEKTLADAFAIAKEDFSFHMHWKIKTIGLEKLIYINKTENSILKPNVLKT